MSKPINLDRDELRRDYESGMSCSRIGRKHGLCSGTICRIMKRYGIQARPVGGFPGQNAVHGHGTREAHATGISGEYLTWMAMKARCLNPKHHAYRYYGGRGITVCQRWLTFPNFLLDMGTRPEGLTLDRIDVNGNYEPSNCRWATWEQQRANQRPRQRRNVL